MENGFNHSWPVTVVKWALAILLVVFLAAPSFIVVPMSFSSGEFLRFPPEELSLRWYRNFTQSLTWTSAARASAVAALATTLIAVPVGALAAYGALQLGRRMRVIVGALIVLPAVIPPF